jgi:hypothetical protein
MISITIVGYVWTYPSPDFHLITGLSNRPLSGFAIPGEHAGFKNGVLMPRPEAAFQSPSEPRTVIVIADALDQQCQLVAEAPRQILNCRRSDSLALSFSRPLVGTRHGSAREVRRCGCRYPL